MKPVSKCTYGHTELAPEKSIKAARSKPLIVVRISMDSKQKWYRSDNSPSVPQHSGHFTHSKLWITQMFKNLNCHNDIKGSISKWK